MGIIALIIIQKSSLSLGNTLFFGGGEGVRDIAVAFNHFRDCHTRQWSPSWTSFMGVGGGEIGVGAQGGGIKPVMD